MRNRLAVLVGLCVACVLSFDANAALWRLEGDALVRRAGAMRTEASLPGRTVKVSARSEGAAWLTSGDSLWSIDHDGQAGPHIDLVNRGFGIATHVAADPYDGSVWIATDAPLLLHIALDGRVEHGTTLAAHAAALVIDLAQGAWLIARDELLHFDRNGAPLEARPLELPIDEAVTALAVDALHQRVWFGSSMGLHYVDARGSGLPPVRVLRGDATALAVDQRRGITLAIVDGGLVAFDGLIRRQGSDAIPAIDAPASTARAISV